MESKKTIKINFCDWWSNFNKENNRFINLLKKHYNVEISDNPDFLFYSCYGRKFEKYNCVKIFCNDENVIPNFNECDYGVGFDYIDFGDRYFRRLYVFPNKDICNRSIVDDSFFNRSFCNFIYSNASSGEGAFLRQEFCKKLMEYKHVDCPGKVLHNMDAENELAPRKGNSMESKIEFLKKYKFTIAFENSSSNGYTTEKLVQPLQSFSIPIYWGNPLVTRDFNPKAFINCNDYDNDFDAVIERVKELDNDPDKYLAMLRENPMQPGFDLEQNKKFEQWFVHIIEKGNKPFNKDPRKWGDVPYQRSIGELQDKNTTLQQENESLQQTENKLRQENDTLQEKNVSALRENAKLQKDKSELQSKVSVLKTENKSLKQKIVDITRVRTIALVKPYKKVKGNWLYKRVETERYIKTYVCGICVRKRSANVCGYVDAGLQELEKRLKKFIIQSR